MDNSPDRLQTVLEQLNGYLDEPSLISEGIETNEYRLNLTNARLKMLSRDGMDGEIAHSFLFANPRAAGLITRRECLASFFGSEAFKGRGRAALDVLNNNRREVALDNCDDGEFSKLHMDNTRVLDSAFVMLSKLFQQGIRPNARQLLDALKLGSDEEGPALRFGRERAEEIAKKLGLPIPVRDLEQKEYKAFIYRIAQELRVSLSREKT